MESVRVIWISPLIILLAMAASGCSDDSSRPADVVRPVEAGLDRSVADVRKGDGPVTERDVATDAAGTPVPATTVGKQLAWLLDAINKGTLDEAGYKAHFSTLFQAQMPLSQFKTSFQTMMQSAPLAYQGSEPGATDLGLFAHLLGTKGQLWSKLSLAVSSMAPNPIVSLAWQSAPELDPAFGALGADDLGVRPYDPETLATGTYTVELLDRATGQPFSPTVSGTTDAKYQYVRLAIPAGKTEVGLRVTHPDGQVTDNYSSLYKRGMGSAFHSWVAGFKKSAFPYYAGLVSSTIQTGKAHVWGLVGYAPTPPAGASYNVGCATATFTPAVSSLYYTLPGTGLPSTTPTKTNTSIPSFYVLNLDPVAYKVTVAAGTLALDTDLPPLLADHISTLWLIYDTTTYKTNPTPAGCKP